MLIRWDRNAPANTPCLGTALETETVPVSTRPLKLLWHKGLIANRAELIRQNNLPPNTSDHHLLLVMYERAPCDLARRIAGTCSYVFWDATRRMITVARDRAGSSELFYFLDGEEFRLSTGVEPIFDSTRRTPKPNSFSKITAIKA